MLSSWLLGLLAGYLFLKEGTLLLRQVRYRGLEYSGRNFCVWLHHIQPTRDIVVLCIPSDLLAVLFSLKPHRATPAFEAHRYAIG